MEIAANKPKIPQEIIDGFKQFGKNLSELKDSLHKIGQVVDKFFVTVFTQIKDSMGKCFSAILQSMKTHPALYITIPIAIVIVAIIGIIIGTIIYIKNNKEVKST